MNCFQLVKSVLDELYVRIPARSNSQRDQKITDKMRKLEAEYAKLTQGISIDYTDLTTRFAYIYKYVTSHANLVFQIISDNYELCELFNNDKVNVTCIGGGPGSDLLGILKYVMQCRQKPFIRCTLFDGEPSWGECWNDVDEKLGTQMRISTFYQLFDVCDENSYCHHHKYINSDLFTLVYFMSEIISKRLDSEHFFSNLLKKAKDGALLLYIDNNNRQFYEWFDSLISDHSWEILDSKELTMIITDFNEEKRDLEEYWEKFGDPKLKANISYRLCRKELIG